MFIKEKHTDTIQAVVKSFSSRKGLTRLFFVVVLLFSFSQGFALGQVVEKVVTTGNSTVVYTAGDSGQVELTGGKITAIRGKALRLLPGTHIKSGDQLTVNIASKACQEAVAEEVAKEEEATMLATAAKQREEALVPTVTKETPIIVGKQLPVQNSVFGQQGLQLTASLVNTTVSFAARCFLITNKSTLFKPSNLRVSATPWFYTPACSWGDCAENIKVMRC